MRAFTWTFFLTIVRPTIGSLSSSKSSPSSAHANPARTFFGFSFPPIGRLPGRKAALTDSGDSVGFRGALVAPLFFALVGCGPTQGELDRDSRDAIDHRPSSCYYIQAPGFSRNLVCEFETLDERHCVAMTGTLQCSVRLEQLQGAE